MQQLRQAIHSTVEESTLERKDIARLMKIGYAVFNGKANPEREDAYFSPEQLVDLQNVVGDFRITDAVQAELHTQEDDEHEPKSVMESVLDACCEHGQLINTIHGAMADGRITNREREACLRALCKLKTSLGTLKTALVKQGN